jgi:hypothetical protein
MVISWAAGGWCRLACALQYGIWYTTLQCSRTDGGYAVPAWEQLRIRRGMRLSVQIGAPAG